MWKLAQGHWILGHHLPLFQLPMIDPPETRGDKDIGKRRYKLKGYSGRFGFRILSHGSLLQQVKKAGSLR